MATNWVGSEKEFEEDVDGNKVRILRLTWSDGRRSFEVSLNEGGEVDLPLTVDEAMDDYPSTDQLRILLEPDNIIKARIYMGQVMAEA